MTGSKEKKEVRVGFGMLKTKLPRLLIAIQGLPASGTCTQDPMAAGALAADAGVRAAEEAAVAHDVAGA